MAPRRVRWELRPNAFSGLGRELIAEGYANRNGLPSAAPLTKTIGDARPDIGVASHEQHRQLRPKLHRSGGELDTIYHGHRKIG
jgi:hypothetical protein